MFFVIRERLNGEGETEHAVIGTVKNKAEAKRTIDKKIGERYHLCKPVSALEVVQRTELVECASPESSETSDEPADTAAEDSAT